MRLVKATMRASVNYGGCEMKGVLGVIVLVDIAMGFRDAAGQLQSLWQVTLLGQSPKRQVSLAWSYVS